MLSLQHFFLTAKQTAANDNISYVAIAKLTNSSFKGHFKQH